MSNSWEIEANSVEHREAPNFKARWCSGPDVLDEFSSSHWSSKGAGSADTIHLYHFEWDGVISPTRSEIALLVRKAVIEIDSWINRQM